MSEGYTQGEATWQWKQIGGSFKLRGAKHCWATSKAGKGKEGAPWSPQSRALLIFILNFSRPELWENIFLLVLRWWDGVTAALGNEGFLESAQSKPRQLPGTGQWGPLNIIHDRECLPRWSEPRATAEQSRLSAASVPLLAGPETVWPASLEPAVTLRLWVPGTTKGDAFFSFLAGHQILQCEPERFLFHQVSSITYGAE